MLEKFAEAQVARSDGTGRAQMDVCVIRDVAYLRKMMRDWTAWARLNGRPAPMFNWTSIYNFNPDDSASAICLDFNGAQALALLRHDHFVRCDRGHRGPPVYVAFLEVAPWNDSAASARLFSGLGPVLLRVACDLSVSWGYGQRLGLHSVSTAEGFYRRLGFASKDCPNEFNELYFELEEVGARALLRE